MTESFTYLPGKLNYVLSAIIVQVAKMHYAYFTLEDFVTCLEELPRVLINNLPFHTSYSNAAP